MNYTQFEFNFAYSIYSANFGLHFVLTRAKLILEIIPSWKLRNCILLASKSIL